MSIVLGNAIKAARLRMKWRQWQLADSMGVTRAAVGQWESGTNEPSSQNLLKISEILGLDLASLSDKSLSTEVRKDRFDRKIAPLQNIEVGYDIPVSHLVATDDGSVIDLSGQASVIYIRHFEFFGADSKVFGMLFATNVLGPKFEQGDIVYVDPSQTPKAGEYGVFALNTEGIADFPSYRVVRRVALIDNERVILSRFHPEKQEEWGVRVLSEMSRIIPANELLMRRGN